MPIVEFGQRERTIMGQFEEDISMAHQVLATKLYIPPIQPSLVRRPRLVQVLENGYQAGKRVTLVSAPAGFGKTTLIRQWIKASEPGKSFGWLSLDDGDNDPTRFLIYLISAIQKTSLQIGQTILESLHSSQVPPLIDIVESLINEISDEANPFLLILDDYHLIRNVEVHSLLQLLLKQQPKALHLIIITREDPPFSLPKMRVQGLITEIRERDLRFTIEEAHAFLAGTMGLALSVQDIGRLEEKTEGWAAGMQLAALALEEFSNETERQAFIEAFTGSNRMIADYLISEVLQRQEETTRQFLLRTSILDRFCTELCDQVVFDEAGEPLRSQSILDHLERENMFLVPLDNQRHWYRYHHLFSEMLSHSLQRSYPEHIALLHRKASEWFELKGFISEAVKHALASRDWDHVGALLDQHALPMLFQGYGSLIIDWCREIPKTHLEKSPNICIYYAWALVLTFRDDFLEAVEDKLQIASRAIERPDLPSSAQVGQGGNWVPYKEWVTGQICVIRSQVLLGHFNQYIDPQELIVLSLRGLELLPSVELSFRATCRINLALAELMRNNPRSAQKAFEEGLPYMLEAGNFLSAVTDIFYQARLAFYTGQVSQAELLCQKWKLRFTEMASSFALDNQEAGDVPAIRGLDIVQSMILLERNQVEEAERLILKKLESLGWASWMELHGFLELARLRHRGGNENGVREILQRMSRLGPQHAACAEAMEALFAIQDSPKDVRAWAKAKAWTDRYVLDPSFPFALGIGPYHRDTEYFCNITWSQVQIALGDFEKASLFITPALQAANESGLLYQAAELSILQALVHDGQGNLSAALEELGRALEIAERCSYTRFFLDSPDVDRLLQLAVEKRIYTSYARQILSLSPWTRIQEEKIAIAHPEAAVHPGLVDPLSEREMEVLRLLATGLPTAEIAKKLFLSPFTLKAHTQNIYTKLGVHSRIEAINMAREIDLL